MKPHFRITSLQDHTTGMGPRRKPELQIPRTVVATIACTRADAEQAIRTVDLEAIADSPATLTAAETNDGWELRLYADAPLDPRLLQALAELAPGTPTPPVVAPLPATDWVTLSQAGLAPVDIGRFHIHTGTAPGICHPGQWPLRIDAGLAFGTGQHATTAGCIDMAIFISKQLQKRNILDVGTGAGILAFCARRLFPQARLMAADIDAIAVRVASTNARVNAVPPGDRRNCIRILRADGVRHRRIAARAPYDLVFANILAGPLVALAPTLAATVAPGGHLVLAGLLQPQMRAVLAAYRARGLVCVRRSRHAEWPVLLLQRPNKLR